METSNKVTMSSYRKHILAQLQERKKEESAAFQDLISFCNHLFEGVDILRAQNVQLTVQKERLQQENLDVQARESGTGKSNEKTMTLEKKVYQLQEELTELHRRKGEHTQQLIDLRNMLEEKEKELSSKISRLQDTEAALSALRLACKNLEQTIIEQESANQILKDEYEALQLAFSSLEQKHQKLEKDHSDLITRWMAHKAKDADRLNAENERVVRVKQAQLQKELEEAAKEPVVVKGDYLKSAPVCIAASVPNKMLFKFDAHDGEVNAVKWSPSGKTVVTGGGDRKLKLWDIGQKEAVLKGTLTGSNAAVMSVDFETEETLVVGASNDFASRVWTVDDLRLRHTLTGHSGKVLAAKFLGEFSKVVSGSHDRTLKIWDLRSRSCIRTIFAGSSCNDLVTSDGSGTNIISGHFDKRIRFWDTRSESSANEILLQGKITSLDLSPDGFYLLSCVRDDTLKLLDLRMNQVIRTFCADGFKVGCDWTRAKFSPDGQYITVGSQDGVLFIWNCSSARVEKTLKEHNTIITACSWNPSGQYIISVDKNKKAIVWTDI
ncbi:autophagy-related protein 16-1-like isoform X1 [Limulus polyphemus]|uniref:Autophagy-related protein 16-1-like isoform X1 n=2 Tax=Limulus polyphemus TaxID=6850 RepID=A0ABM1S3Y7_LIMPO|nr:autophagy-related protein 16-1-like isoform X1 [Limulus polyphemus]